MQHTIKKTILGKLRVYFICPHCNNELNSPLEEAGQEGNCPMCRMKIVTPGEAELLRHQEEQEEDRRRRKIEAAAAAQLAEKQRAEAAERQERERLEAADHQRKVAAQREQEHISNADRMTFSDRLLTMAFKFAKALSVIVVVCCFATIAVCLVMVMTVRAEKIPTNTIPPLVAPTVADYQNYKKSSSQASEASSSDQNSNTNQVAGPQVETLEVHFVRLLQTWGFTSSLLERERDFNVMEEDEKQMLVNGLETFIHSPGKQVQADGQAAMGWYLDAFKEIWQEHSDAEHEAERKQELADNAASLRRQQLLIAIGSALAALLSFLFLPLLIQIEQNTRRTLELQVALNKGRFSQKSGG
ncbi:MAG: hypothetical protein ABSH08_14675 [Tepidisphaeraceae bacterium]